MKRVIIVGSGAGGAAAARELQGDFQVTILEAGSSFKPFPINLSLLEKFKKTGIFLDERLIQLLFKSMKVKKTSGTYTDNIIDLPMKNSIVMVNGKGIGGTTTLSTGSCMRADDSLQEIGIFLDEEFQELEEIIPITTDHNKVWRQSTQQLFTVCQQLGLNPNAIPKMGDYQHCRGCGHCILGCPHGVKWDSRVFLDSAIKKGAELITNCQVERVVTEGNMATGVEATQGISKIFYPADLVILAAGGLGTPRILERSGIECHGNLFVDTVLCLAAKKEASRQHQEISMPFFVEGDGYIIAPYFDHLSFFYNKKWRYQSAEIISLMIKLADTGRGRLQKNKIIKSFNKRDRDKLAEAVTLCLDIFNRLGIEKEDVFYGTLNAGHPGGMMPLTEKESVTLHPTNLPENLYLADSTLLPAAAGKPLILTIMALAKRVSKICLKDFYKLTFDLPRYNRP